MQPLPVGETGVSEGKGKGRGGGSPGLQQAEGLEGWGYPAPWRSFTLARVRGGAPFLFLRKGALPDGRDRNGLGEARQAGRVAPGPL